MSSKYPREKDIFQLKRNAEFEGDPNGDYVMAEDINELQDAILAIEDTLGLSPQANKMSVGDRISLLEGSSVLRVPSFLLYLGVPSQINGSLTIEEAVGHYEKYDHIVFGNNAELPTDEDHDATREIIKRIKENKNAKIYGYIDCGVTTAGLSLSEIQNKIQLWRDLGVAGIYCANFGYENQVDRTLQNNILDSIHQDGLIAILTGQDYESLLSNALHELNPGQLSINVLKGDIYHFEKFVVDTSVVGTYTPFSADMAKLQKLHEYRNDLGINILATPYISSNIGIEDAQIYFEYAHAVALLGSVDMFNPVTEGYGAATNSNRTFKTTPLVGSWYTLNPHIQIAGGMYSRETAFGKIILDSVNHTVKFEGFYIPYELLKIALNSIEGNLLKDGSIEDKKIKSYSGSRVIDAINEDTTSDKKINIDKIMPFSYTDIDGSVPQGVLEANVIQAINANIGKAYIGGAVIGDLTAGHIKSGTIEAERISSSVVRALELYASTMTADSAKIGEAVIGDLSAEKITSGNISADLMQSAIVDALNLSARQAEIENLNADHISTGSIKAERLESDVVRAINLYADSAVVNKIRIQSGVIDKLTASHIEAVVINAINGHFNSATIDAGKIGQLEADNIKASVVDALTLYAQELGSAAKPIPNAIIQNLSASQITAGDIDADRLKSTVVEAINTYTQELGAAAAKIGSAAIGTLNAEHMQGKVISAINASVEQIGAKQAVIDNAKIGALRADQIEAVVISALEANIGKATIDSALIGTLGAEHIEAGSIGSSHIDTIGLDASIIKTGQFHGDRIMGNTIDALKIMAGSLTSREIAAHSLTAREIQAGSITSTEIAVGAISAEHITTTGLDAQRISVYNSKTGETLIAGGYLRVDGLDAGVVQSDNLIANGMFMTASSAYGIKRYNPAGEVIIGTESQVPGGNQIWKYDLETGAVVTTIDVPGKKPAFIAIDGTQQYAYVTVQGNDTLIQLDLAYDTFTENFRPMGKAPTRVKFTGNLLGDMKHLFVVNTDKTDVNAPDSFYVMDVPPHSDFSQLYIHHQIITGNTPYDFVLSEKDKKVYITLADQGDIAVLDASFFPTYQWKMTGSIPISPYGTDNYHGGMTAGYGLGTAVGGDASAEYNKDAGHGGHGGGSHGGHGGYSVSDGTMKEYKPHGIIIDSNENLLVVTEVEQNELVIINRIEEEHFEWPIHHSYVDNAAWIENINVVLSQFDNNPEKAIADGYTFVSPWVPYMGYHFVNRTMTFDENTPNTIMYMFDTTVNQYKVTGAEWMTSDPTVPSPVPGETWHLAQPSMAHYADGLMIIGLQESEVPQTHPETGSALVSYTPFIYGIHFFSTIPNPLGLFEAFNPKLKWHNDRQPKLPPGFESYVDPNVPNSNYHEYKAPSSGDGGYTGGDGGHAHSVEVEEPVFSIQAGDHSGGHTDPGTSIGPDTTGQGLVWKYVRHRIPIGDDPENIVLAHGKVWVTLLGSNKIAVMDETDLYRTEEDFNQGAKWSDYIRYIEVGSKPLDLIPDHNRMKMYVTIQGESKIAVVDMMEETVIAQWTAGANVMSGAITPDGKYLYVTNNGGVGDLSFVYPEGPYIGDAFIGLEGNVQYQGAQFWTPDRSDWVFNNDGTLRSSSTVEFRINEPFLNEGGYVKLSAQGMDQQYAQIEQDIFNVSNFSNGTNYDDAIGEKLEGNPDRTLWYPNFKWLQDQDGGVKNVTIVKMDETGQRAETIPDPITYTIHYDTPRIEFQPGIVPEGSWVEADYVFRANVWFKNHNASVLVAIENSSSRNFNTFFEVDEYVPKFLTLDALQTKPWDYTPIINPGVTTGHYKGIQYSYATDRALNLPEANITTSGSTISGTLKDVVNGDTSSSTYLEVEPGLQSITLDLGKVYMVPKLKVWHFWQDGRTYNGTRTEVSEDGVNWTTVFDSAVSGTYAETEAGHEIKFWAYSDKLQNYDVNYLAAKPVRYVRDWINGSSVNENNHWAEIQVLADWELETGYKYPIGAANEGQQIATNGKGVVTSNISGASATIDLHIDFTSWWYMTYLVGPEFGSFDVEMPTVMGGSHVLPLDNPYINKVAHRHIMSFPPGMHKAVIKQRSGKVAIDRFRFEDYQYYGRSSTRIPSTADTSFTRYKIVPEQARDYVGTGNQSTYGPYDTPRVNPDTRQPDASVPIKYRVRVKSVLDASGVQEERGIAYLTSAIFEQGKLSSHWRPSSSSDNTPGNRIESWDGNQPHRTGIQWFHLANGAVRGTKILPSAIMDYHISPYARIGEYKLDLNHPTHQHGHWMTYADGSRYFMDNKDIIDTIMGWGTSGTSNKMAREDHGHSHLMGDLMVHGNLKIVNSHDLNDWALINDVNVWQHKQDFDSHIAAADLHFSATERTKLAGITEGATKVEASTSGKIKINGVDTTVYAHPTGDGNLHVPATSTTNNGKYLKAGSAAGSLSWSSITWTDVSGKPTNFSYTGHTHTSADITDLSTILAGYATKEELAQAGEVKLANTNVFTNTNTFTNPGLAVKIQPSEPVADNTVLFQVSSYSGNNLVTMGKYTDAVTTADVAKVVINGDLEVTGSTIQKSTQQIEGDMNVTGNLNITGNSVLGDNATDQTTVSGNLVLKGQYIPKGKAVEVGRYTVFGVGGDLQFQADSTVYEDVVSHYWTFQSGDEYPLPAVQANATRKYRLIVAYSTVGAGSAATLKISQYSGTDIISFNLPEVNGSATGIVRHLRTPEFTTSYTGHTTFKALSAGAGKDLIIKHIEVVAYDYFA